MFSGKRNGNSKQKKKEKQTLKTVCLYDIKTSMGAFELRGLGDTIGILHKVYRHVGHNY
jgi:hypothetical protein